MAAVLGLGQDWKSQARLHGTCYNKEIPRTANSRCARRKKCMMTVKPGGLETETRPAQAVIVPMSDGGVLTSLSSLRKSERGRISTSKGPKSSGGLDASRRAATKTQNECSGELGKLHLSNGQIGTIREMQTGGDERCCPRQTPAPRSHGIGAVTEKQCGPGRGRCCHRACAQSGL